MSAPLKKSRLPRIEHSAPERMVNLVRSNHGDDGSHLWVVSYADLLMVLLCFFVLFYSTDQKKRDTVIHRILTATHVTALPAQVEGSTHSNASSVAVANKITDTLSGLNIKTIHDGETLLLELPDNAYGSGQTKLNAANQQLLSQVLSRLKPFSSEIDLLFTGHTDPEPVHNPSHRVGDNIDLSSERAKFAMLEAVSLGFSGDHLRIEGDASSRRQTRTLSITVLNRGINP